MSKTRKNKKTIHAGVMFTDTVVGALIERDKAEVGDGLRRNGLCASLVTGTTARSWRLVHWARRPAF